MDTIKSFVDYASKLFNEIDWLGPAMAGGLASYLAKPRRTTFVRWLTGAIVHLPVALFFGWIMGALALAKGFPPEESIVWAGGGAYLGTNIAELALYALYRQVGKEWDKPK